MRDANAYGRLQGTAEGMIATAAGTLAKSPFILILPN
jgi:hypothetical protein